MAIMTETWTRFRYRLATIPEVVALVSFLAVFLFFSLATDTFLTPIAFANILTFGSITGIMVIGVAMLMISGEFDLSVGATFAVASYVFALSLIAGTAPILAAILALLVSGVLGLINGLVVTRTGIPSFIATLGTMLAYRGIVRAIGSGDFATYTGEALTFFNYLNGPITSLNQLFVPVPNFRLSIVWFLLIALIFSFVLMRTKYGNWTFAAGGSPEAALAQGVNVNRVKVTNFMISAVLAGLAGIMQFAHRSSVDPLRGEGMELIAVAACVIGGTRLKGGVGTIFGAMVGIILLQMLEQGLVLMRIPIQIFQAVAGLFIIISVISNTYLRGGE
jgi:simple sugar transport system permease protein